MQTGRHNTSEKEVKGKKRKQVSPQILVDSESEQASDEDGDEEVGTLAFTPVDELHVNDTMIRPGLVFTFKPHNGDNGSLCWWFHLQANGA